MMDNNMKFAFENHLDNKVPQKEYEEFDYNDDDAILDIKEDETNVNTKGDEVCSNTEEDKTEIGGSILFYELNKYLKDFPIKYTETPLLRQMLYRLCFNLRMKDCDSIILAGEKGCGKTSLVYYYTEKVLDGSIEDCTVLEIAHDNFPCTTAEITEQLICTVGCLVEQGITNLILFFDDFQKFPGCLWTNYDDIIKKVVYTFDEAARVKFIIGIDPVYLDSNEQVSKNIMDESMYYIISQEIIPNDIISVLQPRILELMEFHGIEAIESKVFFTIYSMESAVVGRSYMRYDIFLIYLDKIMASFSCDGETIISFEGIKKYYLDREFKQDLFENLTKSRKDIAKHEAGHTLFALLANEFIYLSSVSVIGIQTAGYGGLTTIMSNTNTGWQTKKNYIKFIAFYLAGRYAEGNRDIGARSDLEKANCFIRTFILTSGVFDELGKDFYWDVNEYDSLSPIKREIVDNIANKMLKKARKYVKRKLKKYKSFVKALSNKLNEELFLDREDVLKIWSEYNK